MKSLHASILVAGLLIAGAVVVLNKDTTNTPLPIDGSNVTIVDGKQVIEISAKGGYAPAITTAQAGLPTILRVTTKGTFDCSSSLAIPALDYRTNLPPSGTTDIEVPSQQAGAKIQGVCSMGMYNFVVQFN